MQGCGYRLAGGTVSPGAMPSLHRWLGNPMLSLLARRRFYVPFTTSTAGCAGSRRTLYDRLDQRCTGMEFATEMIIKASL